MPIRLLIKLFAGLFTIWLGLIWSDNLPNPAWLKEDTESLLAIPGAIFWVIAFWEEIENHFRKRFGAETPTPVHVTIQNILPLHPQPNSDPAKLTATTSERSTSAHFYDSGNRLIQGPDDPILDPLLGKPLHGRELEIKELCALLEHSQADVQVVHTLVLAEGGVGKTELCKAALRSYLRSHPFKKVWFVNLEAASALGDLWQRVADAIGLENLRSEAELLSGLPEGVFYLDNLESLCDVPNLSQHLRKISQKPGLRLLASSRFEVPGWGRTFDLQTLPPAAAIDLFREVWSGSGAQPIPPDAPELEKFVTDQLGCLPLAVVLVAALGRYEGTLAAVMRRWQEEGAVAAQRPGAVPDGRLDSLEHSMRLSLARLSPPDRHLWGLAAFFPAGMPLDFLEALLHKEPTLRTGRDQLLLHRILHRQTDGRLRLSPPLARFARDLVSRSTSVETSAVKHEEGFEAAIIFSHLAPWLQGLGDAAKSDREGHAIARLFEEFPTMEATALFFTCQPTLPEGLMPMLHAWHNFYWRRIFWGKKILDVTLACSKKLLDGDHAWALERAGLIAYLLGENAQARSRYDAALPLYEKVGSDLGKANTLQSLGDLALGLGENAQARSRYDAALLLFEKVGSDLGKANTLRSLGDLAHGLGENAQARSRYDAALPLYEKVGDDLGKANTLRSLGELARLLGENAEARSRYDAALPLFEKVGDDLGKANTLKSLGDLALRLGENAEARSRYDAALPLYEKVGDDLGKANTLRSLGYLARLLGENAQARSHYDAASLLYEKVGDDLGKANTLQSLGDLENEEENPAAAKEHWIRAVYLYQKVSEPMGEGYCHIRLARAAHAASEMAAAQEHLLKARACSERAGTPLLVGQVEALARELG